MIPLLGPKAFTEFTPAEFHAFVRSLHKAPPVKVPPPQVSVKLNAKGNPVFTVRRKPKFVTREEVEHLAQELSWPLQTVWLTLLKRKVSIKVPEPKRRRR